jgi:hypothetical protein
VNDGIRGKVWTNFTYKCLERFKFTSDDGRCLETPPFYTRAVLVSGYISLYSCLSEIGNTTILRGVVSMSFMGMLPKYYRRPTTKYIHHTKWESLALLRKCILESLYEISVPTGVIGLTVGSTISRRPVSQWPPGCLQKQTLNRQTPDLAAAGQFEAGPGLPRWFRLSTGWLFHSVK